MWPEASWTAIDFCKNVILLQMYIFLNARVNNI